jgi:hypothetical protein
VEWGWNGMVLDGLGSLGVEIERRRDRFRKIGRHRFRKIDER